jgi:hypothetical protein
VTTHTASSPVDAPPASKPSLPAQLSFAEVSAIWAQVRLVYPLYAALATQFEIAPAPYPASEVPPARPTRAQFERDRKWLDSIDERVLAYQIRQVPPELLNASEESLRALIKRQLQKRDKTSVDRDKIDLLLVQYFVFCAPDDLAHNDVSLDQVVKVLEPVLGDQDATPLEWYRPLQTILDKIARCNSLRDMLEEGLLEQARLLKDSGGNAFYDPPALVAFCRFNFLLRRAFIRLLHADLTAMRNAIASLELKGVKTVDCRRASLSAAETIPQLRFFCETWRQPFQNDYTQSSVSHAFERLLALRADLEEALAKASAKPPEVSPAANHVEQTAPSQELASGAHLAPDLVNPAQNTLAQPAEAAPSADKVSELSAKPSDSSLDIESCEAMIAQQLAGAPPGPARMMSTVTLQDTKVLLSGWEVAAFTSPDTEEAADMRRAVVARALLAVATDQRKRSGDETALASAIALACDEMPYFQARIVQAKNERQTEIAVNLGISTKRLVSFMEEAEKLRS